MNLEHIDSSTNPGGSATTPGRWSPRRGRSAATPGGRTKRLLRLAAGALATIALAGAAVVPAATPALAAPGAAAVPVAAAKQACATPDFRDVPRTATFYTAVTWLRCEKISLGYANGSYGVGRQITRGETAQLLYRYAGGNHTPRANRYFSDVGRNSGAYSAVAWMKDLGFTNGYKDGTFGANRPISRGELAAFLFRLSGQTSYPAPKTAPFRDVSSKASFSREISWLKSTGLVSGYSDRTFRPNRQVTRGETAQFLYALESRLNGTPPAYQVPSPSVPGPGAVGTNPTGGKGGVYRDVQAQSYSNGKVSSKYHLYGGHLNGARPHGIIVHLHGDGGFEYNSPQWSTIPAYEKLAEQHGLMLVVPQTPDQGTKTWWRSNSSGQYAADLLKDLGRKYNLDLNQVYWTGYSGGAETIARQMMNVHSAGWTGGAAVIVAGGGVWGQSQPLRPISTMLKKNYSMHFVVGSKDTPSAGGASGTFDAVDAVKRGQRFYAGLGMKTSLDIKPGLDHWTIASHGPAKLAQVLAAR